MASHLVAILCALLLLSAATVTNADTIIVDLNGTGHFLTVREGVTASVSGDTVLVYPGTYSGSGSRDIHFGGKAIVLRSRDGAGTTILDPEYEWFHRAFTFDGGEGRDTVVDGFTVYRAVDGGGAGFTCYYSSPTIRNCRFVHCWGYGDTHGDGCCAAGLVHSASPLFEACVFQGNRADGSVGGVSVRESSNAVFRDCVFIDNRDGWWDSIGAVRVTSGSTATFERCTFIGHEERRVFAVELGSHLTLTDCTIAMNAGYLETVIDATPSSTVSISNSVLAFNDCETLIDGGTGVTISHCCLYQTGADSLYVSGGRGSNLRVDPLLCGLAESDYTLCANSPCLPANNEWTESIGAYDEGCPPCNSPVESVTWGVIKALYR